MIRKVLPSLVALLLFAAPSQAILRNTPGQIVSVHLYTGGGADVTTDTTTCYVVTDAGAESAGGAAVHAGHGTWTYSLTQAETDGRHVVVTCENPSAITHSVQFYTDIATAIGQILGTPAHGSIAEDIAVASGQGTVAPVARITTLSVVDLNNVPIADCDVWITSDLSGGTMVAGVKKTSSVGTVTFLLEPGVTYYAWRYKSGMSFTNPITFVAVAD